MNLVYSKNHCPYCDMAKKLLDENGLEYQEINLSYADDPETILVEIRKLTDSKTLPQIVLDGKHIGGYTDLRDFLLHKK